MADRDSTLSKPQTPHVMKPRSTFFAINHAIASTSKYRHEKSKEHEVEYVLLTVSKPDR